MKMKARGLLLVAFALALAGCGTVYSWRPTVPANRRTVAVPTFRSKAKLPEFGSVMARQLAREFQREGTFSIESVDTAALEVQGEVRSYSNGTLAFDRHGGRLSSSEFTATVAVTVIDRRSQKILFDNRLYEARVSYTSGGDALNARRDASGRLADELARQVVDDVLNLKW